MKSISGKRMVKILETRGWYLDRIKGSHHIMKHNNRDYSITVPVHSDKNLKQGSQRAIMRDGELREDDL